jgi:hypothetical protein
MPTTDKGIRTIGNTDTMRGPEQIANVAEDVDNLLDASVPDAASLAKVTGPARWLGRQITVATKKIRYEWDGAAWAPVSWPGLVRHWKAEYRDNAVGGGRTMASRIVPKRPHKQRVHVSATGSGGYGAGAGYISVGLSWTGAGVVVTSNGKTYADPARSVDTGLENGSAFAAAQFVGISRSFDVEIPADVECTISLVNDASIEAYYRLSFEARTYGEGESV